MSTTTEPQMDELELLRKTNANLLQKSRDRKAKLTGAETTIADLQTKLAAAETALHEATVCQPLRAMAETISPVPDMWLAEFGKSFKTELRDGKLTVLTVAGEPAMDGDKPVEFTAASLIKLLTQGDNEALSSFKFITRGSLASGGGASGGGRSDISLPQKPQDKVAERPHFGLR